MTVLFAFLALNVIKTDKKSTKKNVTTYVTRREREHTKSLETNEWKVYTHNFRETSLVWTAMYMYLARASAGSEKRAFAPLEIRIKSQ